MLLCRWILSYLKRGPRFIQAILQRLFSWSGFRGGQWCFSPTTDEEKKARGSPQHCSSLPSGEASRRDHVFDDGKALDSSSTKEQSLIMPDLPYTTLDDGEIISLDNVACSSITFPGSSIRNASQSPTNLELSRRAHEQHVASTSRSHSRASSVCTNSSRRSSESHIIVGIEDAEGTTNCAVPLSQTIVPGPNVSVTRWLNMAHISPTIPVGTQRYLDRPKMYVTIVYNPKGH